MSGKKRKYVDDYLQYGFAEETVKGETVPRCVICLETLSNDALRPSRLQRHLQSKHPNDQNKPLTFFQSKRESFKKMKTAGVTSFNVSTTTEVVEASFHIAQLIAQTKKPHTIGETLVKPCMLKAASLVLGETSSKKLSNISLSDSTIKSRIDELAKDIECQIIEKVNESPFFAIQCDETTDVAQMSQLLVYVRYVGTNSIEEEMLFCRPLETTTKAEDVFNLVDSYLKNNGLKWDHLVGVCTDGAPAMLGVRGGFVTKVKEKTPNAIGTHCVIHREALASKTLPNALNEKLATAIKVVNYIKSSAVNTRLFNKLCKDMEASHESLLFHTAVRWLSKGNMLARIYELREEVIVFLKSQKRKIF